MNTTQQQIPVRGWVYTDSQWSYWHTSGVHDAQGRPRDTNTIGSLATFTPDPHAATSEDIHALQRLITGPACPIALPVMSIAAAVVACVPDTEADATISGTPATMGLGFYLLNSALGALGENHIAHCTYGSIAIGRHYTPATVAPSGMRDAIDIPAGALHRCMSDLLWFTAPTQNNPRSWTDGSSSPILSGFTVLLAWLSTRGVELNPRLADLVEPVATMDDLTGSYDDDEEF